MPFFTGGGLRWPARCRAGPKRAQREGRTARRGSEAPGAAALRARLAPEVPQAWRARKGGGWRRVGWREGGGGLSGRATGGGGVTRREWQKLLPHRPPSVSRVPGAGEGDGGRRRGAHEKQPQRLSAAADARAAPAGLWWVPAWNQLVRGRRCEPGRGARIPRVPC